MTMATGIVVLALAVGSSAGGAASRDRARQTDTPRAENGCKVIVHPTVAPAPATVRIEALVEPSSDNRLLEIAIDSGDFYRSSRLELEGAGAARLHSVEFKSLPSGSYDIRVSVVGLQGAVRTVVHGNLQVTG